MPETSTDKPNGHRTTAPMHAISSVADPAGGAVETAENLTRKRWEEMSPFVDTKKSAFGRKMCTGFMATLACIIALAAVILNVMVLWHEPVTIRRFAIIYWHVTNYLLPVMIGAIGRDWVIDPLRTLYQRA